jgi:hypothetical protein
MTVTVKRRTPIVVSAAATRRAGLRAGQEVEIKASAGVITIVPKVRATQDGYTPSQRRAIDAQLAAAEKQPFHGPFETAEQAVADMKSRLKSRSRGRAAKTKPA